MKIIQSTLKLKWLGTVLVLMFALTLVNCKDDESPAEQLIIGGQKFNLENAKIYLEDEDTYNAYTYRDYFISDGVPNDNSPWNLDGFTDATYVIAVELATKSADGLEAGTFPSKSSWSSATTENLSYIYYEIKNTGSSPLEYDTPEEDPTPLITVSGEFDHDDTMTISFSGNMLDYENSELVTTNVFFSGKIVDIR